MKVGIITIIDNDNYGNRLQNYAVQKVMKEYSDNVITIKNFCTTNARDRFFLRKLAAMCKKNTYSKEKKRRESFREFNENILFTKRYCDAYTDFNKYDCIIVGSDQVWNPNLGGLKEVDLVSLWDKPTKIALSASFGIDEINEKNKESLEKSLSKFNGISVREDSGKKIIEDVIDRKVQVLVDPTMLLSAKEWDNISKRPKQLDEIPNEKYVLNYFLGDLSKERMNEIKRVAEENQCHIINILDKNDPFYTCGPAEFLYLEKNAFLICTDSFHSSVFAILYNRPFIVFDREQEGVKSMNSRIDTLIRKLNLKNRKYNGENITKENIEHDYEEGFKRLKIERKKVNDFINHSLHKN